MIYPRSALALAGTWINELGFHIHLVCGGVLQAPPRPDYGGTVFPCRCNTLGGGS